MPDPNTARRTLVVLALVCVAPVAASYAAYYWLRPDARTNYGELVDPRPAPELRGSGSGGAPFTLADLRGRWLLLTFDGAGCGSRCQRKLYATRQARTMQGRDQDRVLRVLLQPPGAQDMAPDWLSAQSGLIVAKAPADAWNALAPTGDVGQNIFLLDPLGNVVLRYSDDPDIKRLAQDLSRLLRASRIG